MSDMLKVDGQRPSPATKIRQWVEQTLSPTFQKFRPAAPWAPAINLYECSRAYYLVVDLAGVDAEAIDLVADNGVLTLSGERATPKAPEEGLCVHLLEIDHGAFRRQLELPGDVDVDRIRAAYRAGFLTVTLPKKER